MEKKHVVLKSGLLALLVVIGIIAFGNNNIITSDASSGSSAPLSESEVKEAAVNAIDNNSVPPVTAETNTLYVKVGTSGHETFTSGEVRTIDHNIYWDVPGEVFGYFLVGYTKIEFDENICEPIGVTSGGLFSTSISARGSGYAVVSLWYWFFDGNPINDPERVAYSVIWRGKQAGTTPLTYSITDSRGTTLRDYFLTGTVHNMQQVTAVVEYAVHPPASPSNLAATAISSSQINLTWQDDSDNEDNFILEISDDGINFLPYNLPPNIITYLHDNPTPGRWLDPPWELQDGSTHYYRLKAYSHISGESLPTPIANATTFFNAPSGLVATSISESQIDLKWHDNSLTSGLYKIERRSADATDYIEIASLPSSDESINRYSDIGLSSAAKYYYRVRVYSRQAGNSSYSNESTATTFPHIPTINELRNLIDHYYQNGTIKNQGIYKSLLAKLGSGTINQINAFCNELKAQDNKGVSHNAAIDLIVQSTKIIDYSLMPNPPEELMAIAASPHRIDLTWTDKSNNEVGFKIERKGLSPNSSPVNQADTYELLAIVGPDVTAYSDEYNWMLDGITYHYRIQSFNYIGSSTYSNETSASTLLLPPKRPSPLWVSHPGPYSLNLRFSARSHYVEGFILERSTDNVNYTEIANLPISTFEGRIY